MLLQKAALKLTNVQLIKAVKELGLPEKRAGEA